MRTLLNTSIQGVVGKDDATKKKPDLGLRLPGLRDLDRVALDPTFQIPVFCTNSANSKD